MIGATFMVPMDQDRDQRTFVDRFSVLARADVRLNRAALFADEIGITANSWDVRKGANSG